ncbi:MAG: PrsW family glutamic-type intramembrane protease, partial [Planctomycetota bacterium]
MSVLAMSGILTLLSWTILGFAPGLFWLWFFRRKDDLDPEPKLAVLRVFFLGCLSTGAILLVRPLLESALLPAAGPQNPLVDAYVVTALPEELVKFAAFFFGAFLSREFDEPLDGIIYGVAAGLGFASVENVLYLVQTGNPSIVLLRGFTATLGHVAFSGLFGWFVARARFCPGRRRRLEPLVGLLVAVGLHGTYNLFLSLGDGPALLSLLVI